MWRQMALAVENLKFFARIFPLALLAGGGYGAFEATLKLKESKDKDNISAQLFALLNVEYTRDISFWNKVKSGVFVSVVFNTTYSSMRLLHIFTKNNGYSQIAELMITASVIWFVRVFFVLLGEINLNKDCLKDKIRVIIPVVSPAMVSALVGAMGLAIFEIIANTYLGYNLNNSAFATSIKYPLGPFPFALNRFGENLGVNYVKDCLPLSENNPLFL